MSFDVQHKIQNKRPNAALWPSAVSSVANLLKPLHIFTLKHPGKPASKIIIKKKTYCIFTKLSGILDENQNAFVDQTLGECAQLQRPEHCKEKNSNDFPM